MTAPRDKLNLWSEYSRQRKQQAEEREALAGMEAARSRYEREAERFWKRARDLCALSVGGALGLLAWKGEAWAFWVFAVAWAVWLGLRLVQVWRMTR